MDQDIDQVVSEHIKPAEVVIQCKRQVHNYSGMKQSVPLEKVRQIPDFEIFCNRMQIIKHKWALICIAVDQQGRHGRNSQGKPGCT